MRRGTGSGPQVPLALAAALTTWITLWSWEGFVVEAARYLVPLVFGLLLIASVGVLCRAGRFPTWLVACCQLLAVVFFANLLWGTWPLPGPESLEATFRVLVGGIVDSRAYEAPVPASVPGVAAVMVMGGLACHVLVDLLAVSLLRVPIAGLPLLMIYSLPVSIIQEGVPWFTFVCGAAGFLLMLAVQEDDRVSRWGRPVDVGVEPGGNLGVRAGRHHPLAVGASATALAVVVPLLLPTLDLDVLGGAGGVGSGDRTVRIKNPLTNMRRDLVQGPDLPVVRVAGATTPPSYLRLTALTTFTGTAWTPGGRDLPADQAADGPFPEPVGLADDVPRESGDWQVSLTEYFDSAWLPAPLFVAAVDAGEDWRYDAEVLDIHASDNDVESEGLDYTLSALDVEHTSEAMIKAPEAPTELVEEYTRLPADMPEIVERLTRQVTSGADSDFERAVALQDWFRESGAFEYSTDRDAGNGTDDLVAFLSDAPGGRIGYCEQFASAMAIMTRSLGIPTRVAVGFLNAERTDGFWEFSARDLHAWPELYFEGSGWVRFEPTPQDRDTSTPGYTDLSVPTAPSLPTPSVTASGRPTAPTALPDGAEDPLDTPDEGADSGLPLLPLLIVAGVLLVLALAVLGVRAVRRGRAARRWHGDLDPAEAAWAELHDSAVDLGVAWPSGRSPRATGDRIAREFAVPFDPDQPFRPMKGHEASPEANDALDRIVHALEGARYSAERVSGASVEEMRAATHICVAALRAGVSENARRRADWAPRSVLSRNRALLPHEISTVVRSDADVVDHVG